MPFWGPVSRVEVPVLARRRGLLGLVDGLLDIPQPRGVRSHRPNRPPKNEPLPGKPVMGDFLLSLGYFGVSGLSFWATRLSR